MASDRKYYEQIDLENKQKLRGLLSELPAYVSTYFRGITPNTQSRTRIAYAHDLQIFFEYIHKNNPILNKKAMKDITLEELESLKPVDIEEYIDFLTAHESHSNHASGIARKIASLRSFYRYFIRNEMIRYNPMEVIRSPKIKEHTITRLDEDEVSAFLDHVETGDQMTARQRSYNIKNRLRDTAIMTLLLGTGIRVSECVGLDLADIDFKNDRILVHRKGGKEQFVYFGDEVEIALLNYLEFRDTIPGIIDEEALFLSMQKKRIAVRTVEELVKKYAGYTTTVKHITPHKLRSTYGTSLYRETGDIYLVADVLGHSDVNTTKKHYAAIDDDRRRAVRTAVRLREDSE